MDCVSHTCVARGTVVGVGHIGHLRGTHRVLRAKQVLGAVQGLELGGARGRAKQDTAGFREASVLGAK